jgi:hypothetical protein
MPAFGYVHITPVAGPGSGPLAAFLNHRRFARYRWLRAPQPNIKDLLSLPQGRLFGVRMVSGKYSSENASLGIQGVLFKDGV